MSITNAASGVSHSPTDRSNVGPSTIGGAVAANPAYTIDQVGFSETDPINYGRTLQAATGDGSSSTQSTAAVSAQWLRYFRPTLQSRHHVSVHVATPNDAVNRRFAEQGVQQRARENGRTSATFSLFTNARAQSAAFTAAINQNASVIQNWLAQGPNGSPDLVIDMVSRTPLGTSYSSAVQNNQAIGPMTQAPVYGARLILRRNPQAPNGFDIVIFFPQVPPAQNGDNGSSAVGTGNGSNGGNSGGSSQRSNGQQGGTSGGDATGGQGSSGSQDSTTSSNFQNVWGNPRRYDPNQRTSGTQQCTGTPPPPPADVSAGDRAVIGGLSDAQIQKIENGYEENVKKGWAPLASAITALNDAAAGVLSIAAINYIVSCLSSHSNLSSVRNEFR